MLGWTLYVRCVYDVLLWWLRNYWQILLDIRHIETRVWSWQLAHSYSSTAVLGLNCYGEKIGSVLGCINMNGSKLLLVTIGTTNGSWGSKSLEVWRTGSRTACSWNGSTLRVLCMEIFRCICWIYYIHFIGMHPNLVNVTYLLDLNILV